VIVAPRVAISGSRVFGSMRRTGEISNHESITEFSILFYIEEVVLMSGLGYRRVLSSAIINSALR
jgi:hypothetical protein